MRKLMMLATAVGLLFANETMAAAQTSKYGIPSFHTPYAGAIQLPTTTVGRLPNCDAQGIGIVFVVTDATSPTYNGTLTGGGAAVVTVMCNGSAWKSQ